MNWWQRVWQRAKQEEQLDKELEFHIEARISDLRDAGLSEEDAGRRVRQEFGGVAQVKEHCRDARGTRWLEDFFKDIRFAIRQMRRAPSFTAVAVLTLALGIGANTAIFTLVNAVLVKSLPVRDPAQLLLLGNIRTWGVVSGQTGSFSVFSHDLYKHLRDNTGVFEGLCAFQSLDIRVTVRRSGTDAAQPAGVKLVSGNYFGVLGVNAALGRTITPSDDSASAPLVAVVSFRYWSQRLSRNPSVIGSTVELGGVPVAIVGVGAPEFFGETLQPDPPDLWLPVSAERRLNPQRTVIDAPDSHWLFLIGRLKPGILKSQAEGRLTTGLRNWLSTRDLSVESRRDAEKSYIELTPGGSGITHLKRRYAETLRLLLGISILVLLIASINITNLLLARGTARSGETSVRLALGASRGRLIRQSLTESLILAVTGAGLGLLIASAGTKLLIALVFRGADYVPIQTAPDLRVLVFTGIVSLGVALGFGLLPAIRGTRNDLGPVLKGVTRGVRGSVLSRRRLGVGQALIVGQMALSLVLLAAAGLFGRSLANLTRQQFGFEREHVLVVSVEPGLARYEYHQLGPLYQRLHARLNSLPGVRSAAFSLYAPFTNCCWSSGISVQGYTPEPKERMYAVWNRVSPRYFETLGTKVLLGRPIDERDTATARHVVVVTEGFVRRYFRNQNPIGKRFGIGEDSHRGDLEIVGVVENAKYNSPREELRPMAFLPLLQVRPQPGEPLQSAQYRSNFIRTIEVRAAGDPSAIAGGVRQALHEIDPNLPVMRINTLSSQLGRTLNQESVIAELAGFFGVSALLLACIGLYGLIAYAVERRTGEIGIRMALGAHGRSVIGMVIGEVLIQGVIGMAIGAAAALAATRLIANQLYEVKPTDPATLAAAALTLLLCVTVAGYIPAHRASRIDPMRALHYE
ncbi:MAG: ABC transporter permease [Acidobacteria bacterium]|nr:ABC transporter permease [Acidobacteriota bacterium]